MARRASSDASAIDLRWSVVRGCPQPPFAHFFQNRANVPRLKADDSENLRTAKDTTLPQSIDGLKTDSKKLGHVAAGHQSGHCFTL